MEVESIPFERVSPVFRCLEGNRIAVDDSLGPLNSLLKHGSQYKIG